jgi:hypothetical protein
MFRNAIALTLITLPLATGIALGQESRNTAAPAVKPGAPSVHVEDLQPFTHLALIPAGSEKGTIRLERAKMVQVATRITYAMNSAYCEELAFRDPGGSMYCPSIHTGSPATAYELTYSYIGQPLVSDEYADRKFTFAVYFRPDELASQVRQAFTEKKQGRADLAGYFTVTALNEPVRRIVIDEAKSRFCNGNFVDGLWTRSNATCKDEIYTTAIDGPSDYITVKVDPVPPPAGLASAQTVGRPSFAGK